jgi:hypothetical protein
MTFTTDNGSTIQVTPVGEGYDLHLRNPKGETVATVVVQNDAALRAMLPAGARV